MTELSKKVLLQALEPLAKVAGTNQGDATPVGRLSLRSSSGKLTILATDAVSVRAKAVIDADVPGLDAVVFAPPLLAAVRKSGERIKLSSPKEGEIQVGTGRGKLSLKGFANRYCPFLEPGNVDGVPLMIDLDPITYIKSDDCRMMVCLAGTGAMAISNQLSSGALVGEHSSECLMISKKGADALLKFPGNDTVSRESMFRSFSGEGFDIAVEVRGRVSQWVNNIWEVTPECARLTCDSDELSLRLKQVKSIGGDVIDMRAIDGELVMNCSVSGASGQYKLSCTGMTSNDPFSVRAQQLADVLGVCKSPDLKVAVCDNTKLLIEGPGNHIHMVPVITDDYKRLA